VKIQIKHLQTKPNDERETISFKSISSLEQHGIDYERIINKPYNKIAPKYHCRRPEHISPDNQPGELYSGAGIGYLTGRHYGCFEAHTNVLKNLNEDYNYTIIFEADAHLEVDAKSFSKILKTICEVMEKDDVYFLSLANNPSRTKESVHDILFKTHPGQDLAHAYVVRNKDKNWWLKNLEKIGWDGYDIWLNLVFFDDPKNRYTTKIEYVKQIDGVSLIDGEYKIWNQGKSTRNPEDKPILIISSGRRFNYLKETIEGLNQHTLNLKDVFKNIWILDDRSSLNERVLIEELMTKYFGDKYQSIYFNSNEPYAFVDKFNMIRKLSEKTDIIFFLEDDWVLNKPFNFQHHTDVLRNSEWTSISFTDPLWLQDESLQGHAIEGGYWKNPYPGVYKHPLLWFGEKHCRWAAGTINNYTNNPNLSKGEIYHKAKFKNIKNFEWEFAETIQGNHVFHQDCLFNHVGENSLINQL